MRSQCILCEKSFVRNGSEDLMEVLIPVSDLSSNIISYELKQFCQECTNVVRAVLEDDTTVDNAQ